MKRLILIIAILFLQLFSYSQVTVREGSVPVAVKKSFSSLYPGITTTQVVWKKNNSDYFANFVVDKNKTTVKYTETGRWISTETECLIKDCPRSMQKNMSANYSTLKVNKIILIEEKDKIEYHVDMADEYTANRAHLVYDRAGNFVKQLSEKEIQELSDNNNGRLPVNPKELPSNVSSYILANYPTLDIMESYILNNEKYQNVYFILLGKSEAKETVRLFFDYQGVLIETSDVTKEQKIETEKVSKKDSKKQLTPPFPQNKVPAIAVEYFAKKAARAEGMRWDTISNQYVASYTEPIRRTENKMYFDKAGNYVMTSVAIDKNNLLPMIGNYLYTNYPNLEVFSAENQTYANKKKYTVVKLFGRSWINDPMVYHEIYFSTSGRLEKEILADYIDYDEQYKKDQKQSSQEAFNQLVSSEDISLKDKNSVDGQAVASKDLPSKIHKYLDDNCVGWVFQEGVIISEGNTLKYAVIMRKSKERKQFFFDINGNFLKSENL